MSPVLARPVRLLAALLAAAALVLALAAAEAGAAFKPAAGLLKGTTSQVDVNDAEKPLAVKLRITKTGRLRLFNTAWRAECEDGTNFQSGVQITFGPAAKLDGRRFQFLGQQYAPPGRTPDEEALAFVSYSRGTFVTRRRAKGAFAIGLLIRKADGTEVNCGTGRVTWTAKLP